MKNIAVFFGGKSTEHDISIISANQTMKVLKNEFNVIGIYITKENEFYIGDFYSLKVFKNFDKSKFKRIIFLKNKIYIVKGKKLKFFASIDFAIPVMHGKNGEDGTLQGMLEINEIPYIGSKVLSSAICMNKYLTKSIVSNYGVNVVEYIKINKLDKYEIEEFIEKVGFPIICKPMNLGSSIGVGVAHNEEELNEKLDLAFSFDDEVLIEKALTNFTEYNISVAIIDGKVQTSLIEEPSGKDEILSFKDKYKNSGNKKGMAGLERRFPKDLKEEIVNKIKNFALIAYKECYCEGIVRIDFIVKDDEVFLNEINSIPGSLAYYLWKDKFTYLGLLKKLLITAEDRFNKKNKLLSSFDGSVL